MPVSVLNRATVFALATPEGVKGDLGTLAAGAADAQIARFIAQASRGVAGFCRRTFGRETVRETFMAPYSGPGDDRGLLLSCAPVVAIQAVKADGAPLDPIAWRLDEEPAEPVSLFWLRRVEGDVPRPWDFRLLTVDYEAGWLLPGEDRGAPPNATTAPDLPDDVEKAVIQLVGVSLSASGRDAMVKNESVEGVGSQSFYVQGATAALPHPEAEAVLTQYRKVFLA